jgi:uncharacterized membrane protein YedE/YeeE
MHLFATGWPWYVSGPLIFVTMAMLVLLGRRFGVSSNLESLCTIAGAGRVAQHFRVRWRDNAWNLAFIAGAMVGGLLTHLLGAADRVVPISAATVATLASWGLPHDAGFAPTSLLGVAALTSPVAWGLLGGGGFLVGFGTRWASGCTSGHGVSGLADLQRGSLIATVSFFASGVVVTNFILPRLLGH